ncbi:MAG: protein-L-isoaspartate O-methyltransferase [Gammaproteobacteria bacterium]|nr:protein-L-isoaspartate O-methyltransferase [Gammaproteobacteria bacterium]
MDTNLVDMEQARHWMINHQIRPWNVFEPDVLNAFDEIHREDFVPEAYRNLAFVDTEIPLPDNRRMLKPVLEGRLLQALELTDDVDVLVVGTGSGFFTALIASIARHVTAIDNSEELTNYAQTKLGLARISNVTLTTAVFADWTPDKQFDRIVLTGGLAVFDERLPEWLTDGGIAIAPIGEAPSMNVERIARSGDNYTRTRLFETVVPELRDTVEPSDFRF